MIIGQGFGIPTCTDRLEFWRAFIALIEQLSTFLYLPLEGVFKSFIFDEIFHKNSTCRPPEIEPAFWRDP